MMVFIQKKYWDWKMGIGILGFPKKDAEICVFEGNWANGLPLG